MQLPADMERQLEEAIKGYKARLGAMTEPNLWKLVRELCREHYRPMVRDLSFRHRLANQLKALALSHGLSESEAGRIRSEVLTVRK